ncbi:LysR substrate-binding domain-containing protein [Pseudorhodoplanes sp.]|uniref:LysR substrate-binding domain-containing protein n=1 Tax=Pseudorhodoplanes sp. TaxID=1934341 RepID=UPI003D0C68AB
MDRLEAMSILVAAVEAGSFTAASRKLGVPLPTISRKVADLEAHLNARLLMRTTRKLSLTDAGEAYLAASRKILEQVSEAERAASGEYLVPRGHLSIAAPIVFGRLHVLPIVNAFLAAFPEIDIQLVLSDRNADLIGDHLDLAVRIGALRDSSMMAARVGSVRYVVCASPDFLGAHGVPAAPDDLMALPCVTFGATATASWAFASDGQAGRPIAVRSRLAVNTAEAAVDAAVAGVGIVRVLSYQVASALQKGRLRIVLADFEPAPLPVHLLHPAQTRPPLKLRRFIEFAAPRLKAALAGIDRLLSPG